MVEQLDIDLTKGLSPPQKKILISLCIKGEMSKYQLYKIDNKSYSNIHNSIKQLKEYKLIEVSNIKPGKKNKAPVEYYQITILGLINVIAYEPVRSELDSVVKNLKHLLPLLFGKWEFFRDEGILKNIIERLWFGVFHTHADFTETWIPYWRNYKKIFEEIKKAPGPQPEEFIGHSRIFIDEIELRLYKSVFLYERYPYDKISRHEQIDLLLILKKDKQINEFIKQELHIMEKETEEKLKFIKIWRQCCDEL